MNTIMTGLRLGFRYLNPCALDESSVSIGRVKLATHFVEPVTVLAIVRRMLGGLMSSLRMLDSVASGNPLSSISSSS